VKLYVSGPITGRVDQNRPEFLRVRAMLKRAGHDARIPQQFVPDTLRERQRIGQGDICESWETPASGAPWEEWMWFCMHYLSTWRPDGIVLLRDWSQSYGARAERAWFAGMSLRQFEVDGMHFLELGSRRSWNYVEGEGLVEELTMLYMSLDKEFGLTKHA
jgi:hypothetical protein